MSRYNMGLVAAMERLEEDLDIYKHIEDEKRLAKMSEDEQLLEQERIEERNRASQEEADEISGDEDLDDSSDNEEVSEDTESTDGEESGSDDEDPSASDDETSSDENKDEEKNSSDREEKEESDDDAEVSENPFDESEEASPRTDRQTSVAAESLRNQRMVDAVGYLAIVKEDSQSNDHMFGYSTMAFGSTVGNALGHVATAAVDVLKWSIEQVKWLSAALFWFGVKYGPGILKFVSKTFAHFLSRLVRMSEKLHKAVSDRMMRNDKSFKAVLEKTQNYRATLQAMDKTRSPSEHYVDEKGIRWLTGIGMKSPLESGKALEAFSNKVIDNIGSSIQHDIKAIAALIDQSKHGVRGDLIPYMAVSPIQSASLKKEIQGQKVDTDRVESYVYPQVLPNNLLLAVNQPKKNVKDVESLMENYKAAGIFLVPNPQIYRHPESMPYLDERQLVQFIDQLDRLVRLGMQHQKLYGEVMTSIKQLKPGLRGWWNKLISTGEKIDLQNSLVELIYAKQAFITTVYVPAAMDIHDYMVQYMTRASTFIEKNLKAIKAPEGLN